MRRKHAARQKRSVTRQEVFPPLRQKGSDFTRFCQAMVHTQRAAYRLARYRRSALARLAPCAKWWGVRMSHAFINAYRE
jgi:hypothetical protein